MGIFKEIHELRTVGSSEACRELRRTLSVAISRGWVAQVPVMKPHPLAPNETWYRDTAHWFYAITDHQKYCSPRCRVQEHSQGEGFKRKRARYMREKYRPALREHEASAKRVAGREREK